MRLVILAGLIAVGLTGCWKTIPDVHSPLAPSFPNARCHAGYSRLFANPTFEIRVAFGYKDARPARFVADRYERLMFVQRIVGPCEKGDSLCEFKRDEREMDLFTREISGPDGLPRKIKLRVAASSAGPDDVENRADPFQERQSRYAEAFFLDGIEQADVILYNGHSRDGGGPDFRPPRLRGGHVDYGWYQANAPGIRPVLRRLADVAKDARIRMLGFLSCASTGHFLEKVHEARPGLATLTSPKLLYFSDAFANMETALAGLLEMRCEPEFSASLKRSETRMGDIRVSDWF